MCDDRLCRTLPEVQAVVVEELCYVENLAYAFWERLSNIVGDTTSSDLRSLAVHVAHTAVAFTYRHVLQVAADYPYKLAYGDVGANLDALHRCPDLVADPTTMQIRALLESGYNRSSLVDAALLFREIPWSTQAVEQSHGSTACIHRLREGNGVDAIATPRHAPSSSALDSAAANQQGRREITERHAVVEEPNPHARDCAQFIFQGSDGENQRARWRGGVG